VTRASYNSPRRQQAAAATREAIIEAALELFACQGYARTTVAQIAEAARVADVLVPTITDRIDAAVLSQSGEKLKLIANFLEWRP